MEGGDLLIVELLGATNLLPMDKNERSDPFTIGRILKGSGKEEEKLSNKILHGNAVGQIRQNFYRSSICFRTLCPIWNESFMFWVDPKEAAIEGEGGPRLDLSLFDWDRIGVDPLGKCSIPISALRGLSTLTTMTVPINVDGVKQRTKEIRKDGGTLEIQIVYIKKNFLEKHYLVADQHVDNLFDLFFHRSHSISVISRIAYSETTDEMASSICELTLACEKSSIVIRELIKISVESTSQESTLFRTNSTATKIVRMTFSFHGAEHLQRTIGPHVDGILSDPTGFELDQSRIPNEDLLKAQEMLKERGESDFGGEKVLSFALENNRRHMHNICIGIVQSLKENFATVPSLFRSILSDAREIVAKKFPSSELLSVGGFYFLRFFVPSIATPEHFGVTEQTTITAPQRRALTLVSKVIQNMANNTTFGNKEGFMTLMNSTIQEGTPIVQQFLEDISAAAVETSRGTERTNQQWRKRRGYSISFKKSEVNFSEKGIQTDSSSSRKIYPASTIESMAYLISRLDSCYNKVMKEFISEGNVEAQALLSKIQARINLAFDHAESDTSSLIKSMTVNSSLQHSSSTTFPPSQNLSSTAMSSSLPALPSHSQNPTFGSPPGPPKPSRGKVPLRSTPSSSSLAFAQPVVPSVLAELTSRKKVDVIWRAADRPGTDVVELGGSRNFEHVIEGLGPGLYHLKFGLIPSKAIMSISFDVRFEFGADKTELIRTQTKLSPNDEEHEETFFISATMTPVTMIFSCATSKGFQTIKMRASLIHLGEKTKELYSTQTKVGVYRGSEGEIRGSAEF